MGCINRVELSGNLVRTPEIRATQSGSYLAVFGIAINFRKADGTEAANFFDCVKFMGANPSAAMQNFWAGLEKGRKVCIAGRLRQSRWEKDGEHHSRVEIIVDEIDTIGRPAVDPQSYSSGQQMPLAATPPQAPPMPEVYDEDIPF